MANTVTMQTPVEYSNDTIRLEAERIVRLDVLYCVSSLISSLSNPDACEIMDADYDDVLGVCVSDDWETPAREYIDGLDADELKDIAEYLDVDGADAWDAESMESASMEEAIVAHCEEDSDQWRELCDYCRIDSETVEALEHWIVSSWLASRLEDQGEMVGHFCGLTVWGRRTSGQSISMDHVILTIARDLLAR